MFIGWIVLVLLGLTGLSVYSHTPSQERLLEGHWNESLLGIQRDGSTLIYLIHPECPCTLASNFELQRILQKNYPTLNIITLIRSKDTTITSPISGDLVFDTDGDISRSLGIQTSGHVILYDSTGKAVYSGGVTPSRGHRGSNYGSHSLTQLLNSKNENQNSSDSLITFFTYGCKLNNRES